MKKLFMLTLSTVLVSALSSCFPLITTGTAITSGGFNGTPLASQSDQNWRTSFDLFTAAVKRLDYNAINDLLVAPYFTPMQISLLEQKFKNNPALSESVHAQAAKISFEITRVNQPNQGNAVGLYLNYTINTVPREIAVIVAKDSSGAMKIVPTSVYAATGQGGTIFAVLGIKADSPDVLNMLNTIQKELGIQ